MKKATGSKTSHPTALDNLAAMMKASPDVCVSKINYYSASSLYSVSLQNQNTGRFYFGKGPDLGTAVEVALSEVSNQKS